MSGMPDKVWPAETLRTIPASRTWPARNERLASFTLATSCCSVTPNSDSFSGSGSTLICWAAPPEIYVSPMLSTFVNSGTQFVGEFRRGPCRSSDWPLRASAKA